MQWVQEKSVPCLLIYKGNRQTRNYFRILQCVHKIRTKSKDLQEHEKQDFWVQKLVYIVGKCGTFDF